MHATNYIDLKETPDKVRNTIKSLASNAVHLATLLAERPYPPPLRD